MTDIELAVMASNQLTGDWLDAEPIREDMVISGFSAWSLLAALACGATGQASAELEAVTTVDDASMPNALWNVVGQHVAMALGLWTTDMAKINPGFDEAFPSMKVAKLPLAEGELNRWAAEATNGMVTELPAAVSDDTLMLAASALALEVDWEQPFDEAVVHWEEGTALTGLQRSEPISDAASIAHGECSISRYVCRSTSAVDVHLVAGAHHDEPAAVLRTALACLDGTADVHPASSLRRGHAAGCLSVEKINASREETRIVLPRFSLAHESDLTDHPAIFGLSAATDTSSGHFGRISPTPLAIEKVLQSSVAEFSECGFRAAAVTTVAWMGGAAHRPEHACRVVSLTHDRPFGFLAVHRATNLVLFAGWIATPEACEPWNLTLRGRSDAR